MGLLGEDDLPPHRQRQHEECHHVGDGEVEPLDVVHRLAHPRGDAVDGPAGTPRRNQDCDELQHYLPSVCEWVRRRERSRTERRQPGPHKRSTGHTPADESAP